MGSDATGLDEGDSFVGSAGVLGASTSGLSPIGLLSGTSVGVAPLSEGTSFVSGVGLWYVRAKAKQLRVIKPKSSKTRNFCMVRLCFCYRLAPALVVIDSTVLIEMKNGWVPLKWLPDSKLEKW
jgi:hypothetical protein